MEEEYGPEFETRVTKEIERLEKYLSDNPDLSYGLRVRYEGDIWRYKSAQNYRKQLRELDEKMKADKIKRKDNFEGFKGVLVMIFALAALFGFLLLIKTLAQFKVLQVIFIIFGIIMFFVVLSEKLHWISIKNRKYDNSRVKGIRRKK